MGRPGVDFPILTSIPHTDFSCKKVKKPGYYADPETDCQVNIFISTIICTIIIFLKKIYIFINFNININFPNINRPKTGKKLWDTEKSNFNSKNYLEFISLSFMG